MEFSKRQWEILSWGQIIAAGGNPAGNQLGRKGLAGSGGHQVEIFA